jgi:hypothetical protein
LTGSFPMDFVNKVNIVLAYAIFAFVCAIVLGVI